MGILGLLEGVFVDLFLYATVYLVQIWRSAALLAWDADGTPASCKILYTVVLLYLFYYFELISDAYHGSSAFVDLGFPEL